MLNESNFIVRLSGRKAGHYYIDHSGIYKVVELAKAAGMEPSAVKEIYTRNGGVLDESMAVYYFASEESAKRVVKEICSKMKLDAKGRFVLLTEAEIEYIRKALINEGVNTIHIKSKIKDAIFKKLNG